MRSKGRKRQTVYACIAASFATVGISSQLKAAVTTSWNKSGSGNFNSSFNWTSGVPGAADTAQFNKSWMYNVSLDISPSISSMSIGGSRISFVNSISGRTFSISGTLNVNTGSMTLNAATPITMTVGNNTGLNAPVSISNGNHLSLQNTSLGGTYSSSVTVDGSGSDLSISSLGLGNASGITGSLSYSNGATGALGTVSIATFSSGTGNLNIRSGAVVTSNQMDLATNAIPGTHATVTLTGTGSTLTQGGGMVSIGAYSSSQGTFVISNNAGATLNAGLAIYSTGEMDIQSGGAVSVGSSIAVYGGAGTRGNLILSGSGSTLNQTFGAFTIGASTGSTATVQINSGAACTVSSFGATVNPTGLLDVNGGQFNTPSLQIDGGNATCESGTINVGNLTLTSSGALTLSTDDDKTLRLNTLAVDSTSKLDLNDNDLVVTNGDFSTIQALVLSGHSSTPDSSKTGIISTVSQNTGGKTILELVDNSLTGYADWPVASGHAVDTNAIIGKYTYYGDTNLDGAVTGDDYSAVDANLGSTPPAGKAILLGDTNFDGAVTGDDYSFIDADLGMGVGNQLAVSHLSAVPEPASTILLGVAALAVIPRRRKRPVCQTG